MDSSESESESDDDTATPEEENNNEPPSSKSSTPETNSKLSEKSNGNVKPLENGEKRSDENGYKYVTVVNINSDENAVHQNGTAADEGTDDETEDNDADHNSVTVINVQDGTKDNDIVQFLGQGNDNAEARLAAKRQARAEAREIRMREIERQQKENDDSSIYDTASPYSSTPSDGGGSRSSGGAARLNSAPRLNSYQSSRRSSEDSLEESNSLRDIAHELRKAEDKFRKAMIENAQLDNEKATAIYQVDLYKDRYEEMEESYAQLQREHREKCRELDLLKRDSEKLNKELYFTRAALEERDRLIQEQGLVIVGGDTSSSSSCGEEDEENETKNVKHQKKEKHKRALVSADMASLLDSAGKGSLDVRLKRLASERNDLSDELRHIKLELEEEKAKVRSANSADMEDLQKEVSKQISEYKFKLQKAEQDICTLQTTVTRLESQVSRYKNSTETLEKSEETLKVERRKLLRELRESQARVEELETAHSHLQKRLDKLKNAKSALLKDL